MSEFPTELRLRNTGIINEHEGFGIIFTTTGSGYLKKPYVRKDISDARIAELEAQVNRVCEWKPYINKHEYTASCLGGDRGRIVPAWYGVQIDNDLKHCPYCGGKIKKALLDVK